MYCINKKAAEVEGKVKMKKMRLASFERIPTVLVGTLWNAGMLFNSGAQCNQSVGHVQFRLREGTTKTMAGATDKTATVNA
jgi:hypothetical protein